MIMKVCSRCGKPVPYPLKWCSGCKEKAEKEEEERKKKNNKRYYKTRDKKYIRFYASANWKILRDKYKQDKQYKCEICGRYATEVHHKIPIQIDEGWERRLDYNNLECVCVDCHNKKHKRFQKRKNKR